MSKQVSPAKLKHWPKKGQKPSIKLLFLTISMPTENLINCMLPARYDAFANLFQETSVPKFSMIFLESIMDVID